MSKDAKKDATVTPKKDEADTTPSPARVGASSGSALGGGDKRCQLYIGNLTWWTTDQDIQDSVQNLGVADFIEVKFYENRANGQSKVGYHKIFHVGSSCRSDSVSVDTVVDVGTKGRYHNCNMTPLDGRINRVDVFSDCFYGAAPNPIFLA